MSLLTDDEVKEIRLSMPAVCTHADLIRQTEKFIEAKFEQGKRDAVPEDVRKDAERYRWPRDANQQLHEDDPCVSDSFFNQYFESDLDNEVDKLIERNKAIDAAITAAPKEK